MGNYNFKVGESVLIKSSVISEESTIDEVEIYIRNENGFLLLKDSMEDNGNYEFKYIWNTVGDTIPPEWNPDTNYNTNDEVVMRSDNERNENYNPYFKYVSQGIGTSGSNEPEWVQEENGITTDGSVSWLSQPLYFVTSGLYEIEIIVIDKKGNRGIENFWIRINEK